MEIVIYTVLGIVIGYVLYRKFKKPSNNSTGQYGGSGGSSNSNVNKL